MNFKRVITTNVGLQEVNCICKVEEYQKQDMTLFEKYILRLPRFFRRVDVEFDPPVRENRDKDYLGGFTKEGNDATYSVSMWLDEGVKAEVTVEQISAKIDEYIAEVERSRKQRTIERTFMQRLLDHRKFIYGENFNISLETAWIRYPFHSDALSGWTSLIAFELRRNLDADDVWKLQLAFFGAHFWLSIDPKPRSKKKKDFKFRFNLTRANGFELEFGGKSKQWSWEWDLKKWKLNPWKGIF